MSKICDFGTAPEQKAEGFKGIGTVRGTETEVLEQFFSDDVRLVKSGEVWHEVFEFYVMVK